MTKLQFIKKRPTAIEPFRGTPSSAGIDLALDFDVTIPPNKTLPQGILLGTGLSFVIPSGYHLKMFLRSSTGRNTFLRLAHGTGIIDEDYQGEVFILIENIGLFDHTIPKGTKLVQLILEKTEEYELEETTEDTRGTTERGEGGCGSTTATSKRAKTRVSKV